uniref:Putative salivary lipocalin n=1 Tax=Ixodes ricinus TaxID=34613 RepID=A0A0K8RHF9_IXORI
MELVSCPVLLSILVGLVNADREKRIDEYPDYWKDQDIRRALNNSDRKSWLIYRTYSRDKDGSRHLCVYADVQEIGSVYTFVQGYIISNGEKNKTIKETLYAHPYKTENRYIYDKVREHDNAMRVTQRKDDENGQNYQLIYSDYQKCDILRVLNWDYGYDCELYVHDKVDNLAVPAGCEAIYKNACGKDERDKKQVSNKSCRETSEVTPNPPSTLAPPEKEPPEVPPETESTSSTQPPGC